MAVSSSPAIILPALRYCSATVLAMAAFTATSVGSRATGGKGAGGAAESAAEEAAASSPFTSEMGRTSGLSQRDFFMRAAMLPTHRLATLACFSPTESPRSFSNSFSLAASNSLEINECSSSIRVRHPFKYVNFRSHT